MTRPVHDAAIRRRCRSSRCATIADAVKNFAGSDRRGCVAICHCENADPEAKARCRAGIARPSLYGRCRHPDVRICALLFLSVFAISPVTVRDEEPNRHKQVQDWPAKYRKWHVPNWRAAADRSRLAVQYRLPHQARKQEISPLFGLDAQRAQRSWIGPFNQGGSILFERYVVRPLTPEPIEAPLARRPSAPSGRPLLPSRHPLLCID